MNRGARAALHSPAVTSLRRLQLERWIDHAIALLDEIDGDADLEDDDTEDIDEREVVPVRIKGGAGL